MEGNEPLEYQPVPPQDQPTSSLSNEDGIGEGVSTGDELGEGDEENSKASGGVGGDPKYRDGEGVVAKNCRDNACGDEATFSAPLSGVGTGDNSNGSMVTTNSTKSNTEVSAMQNLNNLAIAKSSLREKKMGENVGGGGGGWRDGVSEGTRDGG